MVPDYQPGDSGTMLPIWGQWYRVTHLRSVVPYYAPGEVVLFYPPGIRYNITHLELVVPHYPPRVSDTTLPTWGKWYRITHLGEVVPYYPPGGSGTSRVRAGVC